ncbi:SEFIR domain-containing protein [Agrobacterium tumefaciens]|uniref:SEFIR domain-containing protein n=1 Tax=Agrobacterium tumefaciens TaxID=358 RepID=UPI0015731455|nr:TIR domain-containing protein [Agrobacterium tumefaciens]NTD08624.1 TIR domain-containing protein [Agrobacterium tumefaciens]
MPPKLFISYSWSTPDYEQDILRIATEMRDAGIDVILDKWDLKEGHEATAFMEKMVADEHIKKVAIFCDKTYKDKADGRKGGVGTETQIISSEVYKAQDQNKFVAVVMERDDNGKACLPVYYSSRIYIDLSDPAIYATQFERLLRWVYDKPLDAKPEIGKTPAFLTEASPSVRLATAVLARRAQDSIRNGRDNALPATREYFDALVSELEKLRLVSGGRRDFDDDVVKSIEDFLPYRDELIDILSNLALYRYGQDTYRLVHRFIEQLLPYLDHPPQVHSWTEWDFDNYRFLVQEIYLYTIAIMLKYERFDAVPALTSDFFSPQNRGDEMMSTFESICRDISSLTHRIERLKLSRISLIADLLKERCKGVPLQFADLMQADLVLYLKSQLGDGRYYGWVPETLMYASRHGGAFEIFARSQSSQYFQNLKKVLGISSKQNLLDLAQQFDTGERQMLSRDYRRMNFKSLIGLQHLETAP